MVPELLRATGAVMAQVLNSLPESTRHAIAEAHEAGAWLELRIATLDGSSVLSIVVVGLDGRVAQIARLDESTSQH